MFFTRFNDRYTATGEKKHHETSALCTDSYCPCKNKHVATTNHDELAVLGRDHAEDIIIPRVLEQFSDSLEFCERAVFSHGEVANLVALRAMVNESKDLVLQGEFDDVSNIFILRYSDGTETIWSGKAAIAGYCLASSESNKNTLFLNWPPVGQRKIK